MSSDPYAVLEVRPTAPWAEVRAAYWALARRYHPDGTAPDCARMTEINAAYEAIERERRRAQRSPIPTGPGRPPTADGPRAAPPRPGSASSPEPGSLLWRMMSARHVDTPMLDFGEYAGWRIADVARQDPRYLRWLSRHSMGMRYRKVIEEVLGPDPEIGRRAAIVS